MPDYPYDGTLVADPVTFQRATNASITVYDINDLSESTPLALKDLTGLPLANPLKSSADAFVQPFVAPVDGVKLVGAGLTVVVYSHKGMRDAAEAAAIAAQSAAANAAAAAAADLASRIANGQFKGDKGADGANVLPTQEAIEQALVTPGPAKTALDAKIAVKLEVAYHLGNASLARPSSTGPVLWVGWVSPTGMLDGDMYMVVDAVEPALTWHAAYSASALSLTDGASVASLTDTSGNGRHAVQATSTKQPKWYAGGSLPYVRFDGVDDVLKTAAFASPLAKPGTLVLVARLATVTVASSPTKEMVNGLTSTGEWSLSQRGVSGNAGSEVWQAGAGTRRNGPATDKPAANQWFIFTFVNNGATSYLRVNGSQTANADYGANSLDGITLGSQYTGIAHFADMDLGEFRLAPSALSTSQVAELETYFAGKYGITL